MPDGRVDRVSVVRFAVHEEAHEAAEVAIAIENEFTNAGMLGLDRLDTRSHRLGVNLDETQAARRSPVARGHLYLRHLPSLRLRVDASTRV